MCIAEMYRSARMLATFSIICFVATLTLGVPLDEQNYKLSIHSRVAYDDSKFLTSVPTPVSRFLQLL